MPLSTSDVRLIEALMSKRGNLAIGAVGDLAATLAGKQAAGSYATLSGGLVPTAQLGSGSAAAGKYLAGDQTWTTLPAGSSHTILGATHTDAVVAAVVRGDLLIGNVTPAWDRLPKGVAGQFLKQGANDPAWAGIVEGDVSGLTADLAAKEATANKGVASGYASLDAGTKIPIAQIPTGSTSTTVAIGNDARLSDARTPLAHATSHKSAGSDAVKLDELAAPTDVTTLNSSTAAHGLLPKLSNVSTQFLNGTGGWTTPAGGGGSPAWHGNIYGAMDGCDPAMMFRSMQMNGCVAPTPTAITASIARCCLFRPPANITVNKIRFYGVGATTGIYRVGIYRYSTLARLAVVNDFNTSANAWGSAGSALGLALTAGVLYFVAVAVDTTGTTAGIAALGPTVAATTGRIATAPQSLPGNLDADAGYLDGYCFQFAVTTGALPDPAATLAAQAAWTGGMPAFFLDNNNA